MSHVREKTLVEKLRLTRSLKTLAQNFLLRTMAGQKFFLFNDDLPRIINISFNEKTCFYSCTMCPYAEQSVRDMYKDKSEMSFETLKNLVASVPNDSYHSFDIAAIGETLQFKRLPEFIAYMKKERPRVNTIVSTNGLLLSDELFIKLAESGLDSLQISLFAENAKDHEMITKTETFEKVAENIRRIGTLKKARGLKKPYLQTFMMEAEETKGLAASFIEYWSQFVDKAFIRPIYTLGRPIKGLTPSFAKPSHAKRYPCIIPWYSTAIRSNGDVLHCTVFHWHEETRKLKVGNINEKSLKEIWQDTEFRKFRAAHRALKLDDYPICKSCDQWSAYTDVWSRTKAGFSYAPVRPRDFVTPAPEHRGG